MRRLAEADAVLICVPTPLNESRDPDLLYVEETAKSIAAVLRPGQLIVLESTTYPGTTRDVVLPILAKSGLKVGKDFFLAYSPEREDPGNPDYGASGIPKVVGGIEPTSAKLAEMLVRPGRRADRAGLELRSRRSLQDPGKHLSRREHRAGQRVEDALRPHGHRRVGSDRGRQDQAVWLSGVLSRAGLGRALHPDRSFLLELGGPQARPADAVHRTGRRDQYQHAALCDRSRHCAS